MKISTINAIYWAAIATFWALFISDLVITGDAPAYLKLVEHLSVYVFLSAQFYVLGAKRSAKRAITYHFNIPEESK